LRAIAPRGRERGARRARRYWVPSRRCFGVRVRGGITRVIVPGRAFFVFGGARPRLSPQRRPTFACRARLELDHRACDLFFAWSGFVRGELAVRHSRALLRLVSLRAFAGVGARNHGCCAKGRERVTMTRPPKSSVAPARSAVLSASSLGFVRSSFRGPHPARERAVLAPEQVSWLSCLHEPAVLIAQHPQDQRSANNTFARRS
jgi:hypothetical protein